MPSDDAVALYYLSQDLQKKLKISPSTKVDEQEDTLVKEAPYVNPHISEFVFRPNQLGSNRYNEIKKREIKEFEKIY